MWEAPGYLSKLARVTDEVALKMVTRTAFSAHSDEFSAI